MYRNTHTNKRLLDINKIDQLNAMMHIDCVVHLNVVTKEALQKVKQQIFRDVAIYKSQAMHRKMFKIHIFLVWPEGSGN